LYKQVKEIADRLFAEDPIERHPLFVRLESGDFTIDQVRAIALETYHVVDHFPRFLAALLANIPDYRLRMPLADNLFEEHGRMDPRAVHVETYRSFLTALGIPEGTVAASRPGLAAVVYNRAVMDLCRNQPFPEALAAMAVIEEVVARGSPIVSRFARARLDTRQGSLGHFADHATLDVRHANELYELAGRVFDESRAEVERGLALGLYYHRRLYTDLLTAPA
jgi:pyrroloquinoline-quinone synthase